MNFAQMLMQQFVPNKTPRVTQLKGSNKVRHERAVAKYKDALPEGQWLGTHEIADRAGVAHSTAVIVLRNFYGKGLLERRGNKTYTWRWVK